jgi:hypothetical protein
MSGQAGRSLDIPIYASILNLINPLAVISTDAIDG